MQKRAWILMAVSSFALAGCLETDGERALVGAAAGCVASETIDRNGNCVEGALAGGLAGALLDDVTGR
jgi:outer membrane lipoprotein SlyB